MTDERDREPVDGPSSDATKGDKDADPPRPVSPDPDGSAGQEIETDLVIEDRFEATDN